MYSTFLQEPTGKPGEYKKIKALMMPNTEWQRVTMILKKREIEREETLRKLRERQKIKDTSAAIQMEWHDSILTVQSRRIAAALKKQQQREKEERAKAEANAAFFEADTLKHLTISHRQRKYETENFRNVSKALRFVAVLKEQEMQRELNKIVRDWEQKREEKHVQHVLEDIEAFKKEEKEKADKFSQHKMKYKEELIAQINMRKETAEKQKKEMQEKERREAALTTTAQHWYEIALKKERQEDIDRLINNLEEHREINKHLNELAAAQEIKKDKVLDTQRKTDKLIKDKIKEKSLALKKAQQARKDRIKEKIIAAMEQKADTEAEQLQNSLKQEEARLNKIKRQREEFDARILKERKDSWEACLQRAADQKKEDELAFQLSFAQRKKRAEVNEERYKEVRDKDKADRQQHKQHLLVQMDEHKQKKQMIQEMEEARRERKREQVDMEDEEYIKFAEDIMAEAKQRGWPTLPLLRAHELEMLKMGKYLKKNKK